MSKNIRIEDLRSSLQTVKKYVDDKQIYKELPCYVSQLFIPTNSMVYKCNLLELEEGINYIIPNSFNVYTVIFTLGETTNGEIVSITPSEITGNNMQIRCNSKTSTYISFIFNNNKYSISFNSETNEVTRYYKEPIYATLNNTYEFTPKSAYNLANKDYVDDVTRTSEYELITTIPTKDKKGSDRIDIDLTSVMEFENYDGTYEYYTEYNGEKKLITYNSDRDCYYSNMLEALNVIVNALSKISLCLHKTYVVAINSGIDIIANYIYSDDVKIYKRKLITADIINNELNSISTNYLSTINDIEYTPENDYNPSTKKYVDDSISSLGNVLSLYTNIPNTYRSICNVCSNVQLGTPKYLNTYYYFAVSLSNIENLDSIKKSKSLVKVIKYHYNGINYYYKTYNYNTQEKCIISFIHFGTLFVEKRSITVLVFIDTDIDEDGNKVDSIGNNILRVTVNDPQKTLTQEELDALSNMTITIDVYKKDYLDIDNNIEYIPTTDYNPTTKKYVDDLTSNNQTTDEDINNMLTEVLGGDYIE